MKSCDYCGKENDDTAVRCVECGTEAFKSDAAVIASPPDIATSPPLRWRDIISDPPRLFRALVIVSNGAYLLSLIAPYVESRFLSYEAMDLLNQSGHGAWLTIPAGILWLIAALYLAVAVGLYHFSASARTVFTIFIVTFGFLILCNGVSVTSPLVGFLGLVIAVADGAILLLAYATPLKARFE